MNSVKIIQLHYLRQFSTASKSHAMLSCFFRLAMVRGRIAARADNFIAVDRELPVYLIVNGKMVVEVVEHVPGDGQPLEKRVMRILLSCTRTKSKVL